MFGPAGRGRDKSLFLRGFFKPAVMKKHNFSAGPAILPASVMKEAAAGAIELNNSGLSILEISHRSPAFTDIIEEAESLARELMGLGEAYAVLFLSGGASSQFFMAPQNLLDPGDSAGYVDTGTWSSKAIKEAKLFADIRELASSKAANYTYIPKGYDIPSGLKYLHLTSNNTIFGTQYHRWPEAEMPIVCDMSSDIFSRPIPVDRFGLIYAGAQKNMGPAGVTLVIVRKDWLTGVSKPLPSMLDYRTHIKEGSLYNTPPVFPIYVSMLTLRWVKAQGGLEGMAKHNEAKAKLLYDEIDTNPLFRGTVTDRADRSLMNVTYVMAEGGESLEKEFLQATKATGCEGLEGHRSVGGFRASIYNAMPRESVQVLVDVMRDLADRKG
jgi:phosphoserine aminotransferase